MKEKYPHLMAFYYDAKKVKLTWRFDEQQADGIHRVWNLTKMKNEIKSLLDSQPDVEDEPAISCEYCHRPLIMGVCEAGCGKIADTSPPNKPVDVDRATHCGCAGRIVPDNDGGWWCGWCRKPARQLT